MAEGEAEVERPPGDDTLPGQQRLGRLAERRPQDGRGHAQARRAAEGAAERGGEVAHRRRVRGRAVDGAAHALVVDRPEQQRDQIVGVHPRDDLRARPDRAAGEEPEGRQHRAQGAALGAERDADAHERHPQPERLGAEGRRLPVGRHVGEKVVARRRVFGERLVGRARAVVADGRRADERPRPRRQPAERLDQPARAHDAAVVDAPAPLVRPAGAQHRLAREVDDRVGARERARPGAERLGPPGHDLGARRQARRAFAAREHHRPIAPLEQARHEAPPDEARAARHHDGPFHVPTSRLVPRLL